MIDRWYVQYRDDEGEWRLIEHVFLAITAADLARQDSMVDSKHLWRVLKTNTGEAHYWRNGERIAAPPESEA